MCTIKCKKSHNSILRNMWVGVFSHRNAIIIFVTRNGIDKQ